MATITGLPLLLAMLAFQAGTQPIPSSTSPGPAFEVVSIKRNTGAVPLGPPVERPDGGFRIVAISLVGLLSRAYPSMTERATGLPEWANNERYDVSTTSSLTYASAEDRAAMFRAMLADRFKLIAHVETVDLPVYDLVLANRNGRLGPNMSPTEIDCAAQIAASQPGSNDATPAPPPTPLTAPPPRCTARSIGEGLLPGVLGDRLEGDTTMRNLAITLGRFAGRSGIDKTGLNGYYRVSLEFEHNFALMSGRGAGDAAARPDGGPPSIFTAVQEQLGLKLQASLAPRNRLVIDHVERPTED